MKTGTPVKVIDASAAAAVIFGEPEQARVEKRLGRAKLAAPGLLRYELANVAKKKLKRHGWPMAALQQCLSEFAAWRIHWFEVAPVKCFEAAEWSGLTAYDATYLWLARELGAELVTLDEALEKVSK